MNRDLKILAFTKNVTFRQVSKEIGICPESLSRWLQKPLSVEKKTLIIEAIEKLAKGGC